VESWMRSDAWFRSPTGRNYKTEVSEKIYKPLAWFHPFVVAGSVDTLKFIRSQGFETFDHLWCENYDSVTVDSARLAAVIDLVRDVVQQHNRHSAAWDTVTQEKLHHNHHRFFDLTLVTQRFENEILAEIQEFICA
jgi:hypothetical protein